MAGALRTIGQVVAGGIGYALGGPLGFAVANTIFGAIFPPSSGQVRRFGDTNLQGSQVGTFIPQIYGQMGKVQGNVIDCSRDKEGKPAGILIKVKKQKVGGKGGIGAQTQKVEVGYLTAAYMLGEGPLYVDKIVKIDGSDEKAIYDRYATADEAITTTLDGGILVSATAKARRRGGTFTAEYADDGTLISEVSSKIRMYFGTEYQQPDTVLQSIHDDCPAYRGLCYVVFNQYEIPTQPTFHFYVRSPLTGREEIIVKKFEDAAISETRRDFRNIWGHVNGAWVTTRTGSRSLCEALAKLCYTEFVPANGNICDASKVYPYTWVIPKAQMGAHLADHDPPEVVTIEMKGEEEFIADLSIPFNDYDLNYDDNSAHALRVDKEQITAQEVDIPISARLSEMVPFAHTLQQEDYSQDKQIKTALMPENIKVSVGELVTLPDINFPITAASATSSTFYVREQNVSPEGIIEIDGVPYNASDYVFADSGYTLEARPKTEVPEVLPPMGLVLDGPPLIDEMADSPCVLVGACAPLLPTNAQSYWEGALCTFEDGLFPDVGMSAESTMGVLTNSYSYTDEETTRINYSKTINITVHHGSLNSSTEDKVLNNHANLLALNTGLAYNTTYIQFVNATKTGTNTYQINGILPGRAGSDYVASAPIGSNAMLLIDEDGIMRDADSLAKTDNSTIGKNYSWRFYATDEIYGDLETDTFAGNSLTPLSPDYIRQTGRNAGVDITIAWCPRTRYRFGASWAMTRASDPNNFLLEFTATSGLEATVVHSVIITDDTEATISESDLTTWYGSLPANLMVNISQIGVITGPGHRRVFSTPL